MGLTGTQILTAARSALNDDSSPYKWSNTDLIYYFNDAMNRIGERTQYFLDTYTTAIVNITLSASTASYAFDSRVLRIRSAKVSGETSFLDFETLADMNSKYPDWQNADDDTPTTYLLDFRTDYITLYPAPDATGTLVLEVERLPLAQLTTATLGSYTPEIHEIYHHRLIDGVLARAYLKSGSETYDSNKATIHAALFNEVINDIKKRILRLRRKTFTLAPNDGWT